MKKQKKNIIKHAIESVEMSVKRFPVEVCYMRPVDKKDIVIADIMTNINGVKRTEKGRTYSISGLEMWVNALSLTTSV